MAWKNGYYYRNTRRGNTVVSEYIGNSSTASLIARYDELERQKRQEEQEAFKRLVADERAIDDDIDALGAALGDVVTGLLLVSGYHQNDRRWRKRRER